MSDHLRQAIELALANVERGGRPFGAVVVRDGQVIASAANDVVASHDPTAHAELLAIRAASRALGSADLRGCRVYASGQPCPMCLAAMRLAGVEAVSFAFSNEDGEPYGLSTAAIYADLARPLGEQSMRITHEPVRLETGCEPFVEWARRQAPKR